MLSPWWTRRIAWYKWLAPPQRYDRFLSNYETYLSEDMAHFQDLQLRTPAKMIDLVHTVGHDHLVEGASVDALNGIAAQDTVSDQGVDLGGALLLQQFGGTRDGIGGVRQIVDQDCYPILNVTDQHHGGILTVCDLCGAAFLQKLVKYEGR